MYEQLDSDLRKRVGELFENVESPTAEEGWLKLLEKLPQKKKNRLFIIWMYRGAAALVFLTLGLGLYFYESTSNKTANNSAKDFIAKKPWLVKKGHGFSDENRNLKTSPKISPENKNEHSPGKIKTDSTQNLVVSTSFSKLKNNPRLRQVIPAKSASLALENKNSANSLKEKHNRSKLKQVLNEEDNTDVKQSIISETDRGSYEALEIKNQKFHLFVEQTETTNKVIPVNILDEKNAIYKMLAETKVPETKKTNIADKKLKFGVYEATYLNYAKGSESAVNLGVGLSSDIYLGNSLSLSTGLGLARNTLSYSSSIALNAAQTDFVSANLPSAYNLVGNSFNPATSVKNYSAGLLGLDVPINIKYDLSSGANNFYVTAGFSSGTFINETYTYQYGFPAASYPFNQQTQGSSTSKNFDSFYFAKTINFAFGAGLPFGKKRLIAEPFIKYPIGGLGSQNIPFGAGGLNLKFKF